MKLAEPFFLLLLLLVPLVALGGFLAGEQRRQAWGKLVAPRLRRRLAAPSSLLARWLSLGTGLLALVFLIFTLAQPIDEEQEVTALVKGRNIIIAVDASRSMLTKDVAPDRLKAAKSAVYDLLDGFPNDRIGLLAFAGSAVVQAPLTIDHNALRETLDQLDESNVPSGGSNLADAINLATSNFKETGQQNHGLIVISDGELHEGELADASFDAKRAGVFIVAIGMGTREGDFVPDKTEEDGRFRDQNGKPVLSRLNPEPLRTLAAETGGLYIDGGGRDFAEKIDTVISRLDAFEDEERVQSTPVPRFQIFMIPAILLMFASLLIRHLWSPARPRAVAAPPVASCLAFFSLFLLTPNAEAWDNPLDGYLGSRALKNGANDEALDYFDKAATKADSKKLARIRYGQGTAYYRKKDYSKAGEAFSEALLSNDRDLQRDAHTQLGNTLYHRAFQKTKADEGSSPASGIPLLEDAIEHYRSALEITPEHKPALENRKAAEEALKKLKEQQQQQEEQEQQNQQGEGENEDQQSQESEGEGDGQNGESQPEGQEQEGEEGEEGEERQPGENGEEDSEGQGRQNQEQSDDSESGQQEQQGQPGQESDGEEGQSGSTSQGQPGPAPREDETAEEFARRILQENADFQTKALPKHRRQVVPNKDW